MMPTELDALRREIFGGLSNSPAITGAGTFRVPSSDEIWFDKELQDIKCLSGRHETQTTN